MKPMIALNYTGAHRDGVTAAYPLGNGARWYMPGLMRFNAPDTLSPFEAGGPNAYLYCDDDPLDRVDPTGHLNWSMVARAVRRLLTRSGAREKSGSISGKLAIENTAESADQVVEQQLHSTATVKRPSTHFVGLPEPISAWLPQRREESIFHVVRTATLLDKMGVPELNDQLLSEHVIIRSASGTQVLMSSAVFEQTFYADGKRSVQGLQTLGLPQALPGDARVSTALPVEPPGPLWALQKDSGIAEPAAGGSRHRLLYLPIDGSAP